MGLNTLNKNKKIDQLVTGDVVALMGNQYAVIFSALGKQAKSASSYHAMILSEVQDSHAGIRTGLRLYERVQDDLTIQSLGLDHHRHHQVRLEPVKITSSEVSVNDRGNAQFLGNICGTKLFDECIAPAFRRSVINKAYQVSDKAPEFHKDRLVAKKADPVKKPSEKMTPTVSVEDACKIGVLYPVFNYCVRSEKPNQAVTLEDLYQAAVAFQKNPKDNTLRNLIDMQGFPQDFLLEHARERGILTDGKAINELRGQVVHTLPFAFAVAQHLEGFVSNETLDHLNTQPYAKIAEVIIQGRKAFLTKVGTARDKLGDVQILSV